MLLSTQERTNAWIATLLQMRGADIYRMKGVLSIEGCDDKYVYQGVHSMCEGLEPHARGRGRQIPRVFERRAMRIPQ